MATLTLTELKRRLTSGRKLTKPTQMRVDRELKRQCGYKDCRKSLAFRRSNVTFCNRNCQINERTRLRKMNREKKKRYYERHNIKFNKNIRNRDAKPNGSGIEFIGQDLLYENYKEPLKKIEKGKGYGYYGTVAITTDKQYVQCHICGHLFPNVGAHLRKHKITAEDYKKRYGLSATTALISEPAREKLIELVVSKNAISRDGKLPPWLVEYNRKVKSGEIKHVGSKRREGGMSLEKRNKLGLCPEQVLVKIKELADELGHTPSEEEFKKHYNYRYYHSIKRQHGTYLKAVKKLGLKSAKEVKEHTREGLIESLIEFKKLHNRIPMTSDFKRGLLPSRGAYFRFFGTLNNARIEAGMNAVLPMPFGQIVELTPEQYLKYKEDRKKKV